LFRFDGRCEFLTGLLAALALLAASWVNAQLPEDLLSDLDAADDEAVSEALDELLRDAAALREHPLDVNHASLSELRRVPGMETVVALRIVHTVAVGGPVRTLDELWPRAGIQPGDAASLAPYLRAGPVGGYAADPRAGPVSGPSRAPRGSRGAMSLRCRTWTTAGLADPGAFARMRAAFPQGVTMGLALERDPGEPVALDHVAGHLTWAGGDGARQGEVVLGDLLGSWGQGLMLGRPGFGSPSRYPLATDRLRGYDGPSEWASRRGAAARLRRGRLGATLIACRTTFDATVDGDVVTARRSDGLHVSRSQMRSRDAQTEELVGARIASDIGAWEFGVSGAVWRFDPTFASGDPERQRFRFSGSEAVLASLDARYVAASCRAGLEVARDREGGMAWLAACRVRSGPVGLAFGGAYLAQDYWSPGGGGAPGASSGTNTASAWLSVRVRAASRLTLEGAVELRERPWRSFTEPLPDRTSRTFCALTWRPAAGGRLVVELTERRARRTEGDPEVSAIMTSRRWRVRCMEVGALPVDVALVGMTDESDGLESGRAVGWDVRLEREVLGCAVDLSVASLSAHGVRPALMRWSPAVTGESGLGAWRTGISWGLVVERRLWSSQCVALRLRGDGAAVSTGLLIEMRSSFAIPTARTNDR
jgi:hypothetical protein